MIFDVLKRVEAIRKRAKGREKAMAQCCNAEAAVWTKECKSCMMGDLLRLPSNEDSMKKFSFTVSGGSRGSFCRVKIDRLLRIVRKLSLRECSVFFSSYPTHVLKGFSTSEALELVTKAVASDLNAAHSAVWAVSFDDLVVWREYSRVGATIASAVLETLDLKRSLECLICNEPFVHNPVVMTCGHTVCYECLLRVSSCPFCRLPVTGMEKPNFALCKILEKYEQFTKNDRLIRDKDIFVHLVRLSPRLSESHEKEFMADLLTLRNVTATISLVIASLAGGKDSVRCLQTVSDIAVTRGWTLNIVDLMMLCSNMKIKDDDFLNACRPMLEMIYSVENTFIFGIFVRGLASTSKN